MKPRKPLNQMGQDTVRQSIAGKPADVCPYCGAVLFVDGVNRTEQTIVRYIACRNKNCGKRFMSSQPPARIVREVGGDDSASGILSLTILSESA